MTTNQVAYFKALHEANYNYGSLAETTRHNLATEQLEEAKQRETRRHDVQQEYLTRLGTLIDRNTKLRQLAETERSNRANEAIKARSLVIDAFNAGTNRLNAHTRVAELGETKRHNIATETQAENELAYRYVSLEQEKELAYAAYDTQRYIADQNLAGSYAVAGATRYAAEMNYKTGVTTASINAKTQLGVAKINAATSRINTASTNLTNRIITNWNNESAEKRSWIQFGGQIGAGALRAGGTALGAGISSGAFAGSAGAAAPIGFMP